MNITKDLIAASATPLILSILSEGDSYGYAIIKRVRELSGGRIQWTDGMLYPVLHRLEKQGLIESEIRHSEQDACENITKKQKAPGRWGSTRRKWETVYSTLQKVWESNM